MATNAKGFQRNSFTLAPSFIRSFPSGIWAITSYHLAVRNIVCALRMNKEAGNSMILEIHAGLLKLQKQRSK